MFWGNPKGKDLNLCLHITRPGPEAHSQRCGCHQDASPLPELPTTIPPPRGCRTDCSLSTRQDHVALEEATGRQMVLVVPQAGPVRQDKAALKALTRHPHCGFARR